jgi:excinuclease ABC subunit A
MTKYIEIKGARTNNLKNIHVKIPRGQITSIVGISGAGKTSLAFKTLYAEGYLRYIESISPYIRQFLDKIEKPPVERIEGLPPSIAFQHKKPAKNPRSTVATASDIYDYLRILYAKAADLYCPDCGAKVKSHTIDQIVSDVSERKNQKCSVCFEYTGDLSYLVNRGFYFHIEHGIRKKIHKRVKTTSMDILIDQIDTKPENRGRIFEAIDKAIEINYHQVIIYLDKDRTVYPLRLFCPHCDVEYQQPDEYLFSFNSPRGACPSCKGFGDIQQLDENAIFDRSLSISEGGILPFNTRATAGFKKHLTEMATKHGIDVNQPIKDLDKAETAFLMDGDEHFPGISGFFKYIKKKSYKVQARVFLSRYTTYIKCPLCQGHRLNQIALSYRFKKKNLAEILNLTIEQAYDFFNKIEYKQFRHKITPTVFEEIGSRLKFLMESGLSYIQLSRHTFTLSRGEFQRINLAFILGSVLSDSLLIIDQPSADLHPHDYNKLIGFLIRLKKNGNTVLVIEHNRDIVKHSDYILELGPFSGEKGGKLVYRGRNEDFFSKTETITQSYFNRKIEIKETSPLNGVWFEFQNACSHNLKNFDFKIPQNRFSIIAGVSGSGKTTLLYNEIFKKNRKLIKDIIFIDPGVSRARTSTTVIGFFDSYTPIRDFFSQLKESRIHQYLPGHFSFNSPLGRCLECKGKGFVEIEMQFLPAVKIRCGECRGTGFKPEVLKITVKGKNIHDLLNLSINEFIDMFGDKIIRIRDVALNIQHHGMGYLKLGQRLSTLSLGELQRIKLIKYLTIKKSGALFLIDEPTFGLHDHDIEMLKKLIDKIIANQNTVVAADHNLSLIVHSDYIIELGPGGGEKGGKILFQGSINQLINASKSITGSYIKKLLKSLDK